MAAKNKTKYSYGESGGKDLYGVDAPDFRESEAYKSIVLKATGIVYQFGDVSAGNITRLIVGDMEKGYERRRNEGYVADAISSLVSANVIEPFGLLRVLYRKATPVERKVEVVDSQKQNEYKAYQRQINERYPTSASNF